MDYFLCAYPKSGSTWLRYFLSNYYNELLGLDMEIKLNDIFKFVPNINDVANRGPSVFKFKKDNRVPLTVLTHQKDTPKYKKCIFLLRDPRDIIVSYFYHRHYHDKQKIKEVPKRDITKFIKGDFGINNYIDYMNSWKLSNKETIFLYYEDLHRDPEKEFTKVLKFLKRPIKPELVKKATKLSQFDNMKKIEVSNKGMFGNNKVVNDSRTRRVRTGKIGEYKNHLAKNDLVLIETGLNKIKGPMKNKLLRYTKSDS